MAQDSLYFDLELGIQDANSKLDKLLGGFESKADKAGASAGKNWGAGFANAVQLVAGAAVLNTLKNIGMQAIGAYTSIVKTQATFSGTISSVNSRLTTQRDVLSDVTASYEQKAAALGLDTAKIYDNTSATKSSTTANRAQSNAVRESERAFEAYIQTREQELDVLENSLDKLKEENELRLKAARDALGMSDLEQQNKALESQKEALRLEQIRLNRQGIAAVGLTYQIRGLEQLQEENDILISQINRQTEGIEESGDAVEKELIARIELLRNQLKAEKNQFDIDIAPAKRKLEELQDAAAAISVGGGSVGGRVRDDIKAFIDNYEVPGEVSVEAANRVIDNLSKKFGETLQRAELISPIQNLLFTGAFSDANISEAERLASNLIETALVQRRPGVDPLQAINNVFEAFKLGNSALGNLSGLPENFEDIDRRGRDILKQRAIAAGDSATATRIQNGLLTEQEQYMARLEGTMLATVDTQGQYQNLIDSGALEQEKFAKEIRVTQAILGESLLPTFNDILQALTPFIKALGDFIKENPQIVAAFFGIATTLVTIAGVVAPLINLATLIGSSGLLGTAVVFFANAWAGISLAFGALFGGGGGISAAISALGMIMGPIGWIIAGIAAIIAVVILMYNKFEWFRNFVDGVFTAIRDKVNEVIDKFKNNWLEGVGYVIGLFISLGVKLLFWIGQAVWNIVKFLMNPQTWKNAWDGLIWALQSAWDWVIKFLTETDWWQVFKNLGNGLASILRGVLQGIRDGLPGPAQGFLDSIINKIPSFMTGGSFTVPNGYRNDAGLFRASAGERVTVQPATQTYNNENTYIYGLSRRRNFTADIFL